MKGWLWTIIVAASMWGRADGESGPLAPSRRLTLIDDTYLMNTAKPERPFYMDLFEVSRRQSGQVMGSRPENVSEAFDVVFPIGLFSFDLLRERETEFSRWLSPSASDPGGYLGERSDLLGLAYPVSESWERDPQTGSCSTFGYGTDLTEGVEGASLGALGRYWLYADNAIDGDLFGPRRTLLPEKVSDWRVSAYDSFQNGDDPFTAGLVQILRGGVFTLDPHSFIQLEYTPASDTYYHGVRLVLRSEL
ncbi:MAG: hypothetical protein J6334_05920 [Kiritimatiellae bacterium]|nr:hypothetical protein [Kiritimatiellia bacterium]